MPLLEHVVAIMGTKVIFGKLYCSKGTYSCWNTLLKYGNQDHCWDTLLQ
jgi:hypothetical protein